MEHYEVSPLSLPKSSPNNIKKNLQEDVQFDPKKHLDLTMPMYIKTLDGENVPFPLKNAAKHNVAFSAPFKVLSAEGVKAFRRVISQNEDLAQPFKNRQKKAIRGIAYRSKFFCDFTYSPIVLKHLSKCTGKALAPHNFPMNISQINFGEIGSDKGADVWHIDSVPYVLVILLSDSTGMVGGQLQVSKAKFGDPKLALEYIRRDGKLPEDMVNTVNYPAAGYGIFMQGSRIAHAVTPVLKASEPRLTLVNSYQSLMPFEEDATLYKVFQTMDGDAAPFEYARHKAWRASGQLNYLMKEAKYFGKTEKIASVLNKAIDELVYARDLITGKIEEDAPYKDTDNEDNTRDIKLVNSKL